MPPGFRSRTPFYEYPHIQTGIVQVMVVLRGPNQIDGQHGELTEGLTTTLTLE